MSERFGYSDKDWAEISDPATICDRLRGQYNVPVNDGAGPLNGSMVFNRSFQTTPIQNAAADLIDQLQATVAEQAQEIERLRDTRFGRPKGTAPYTGKDYLAEARFIAEDYKDKCVETIALHAIHRGCEMQIITEGHWRLAALQPEENK